MHEMSIALNVVEIATHEAQANGGSRIESIDLDVGRLSGVLVDSLEFCFEAASRETLAEAAALKINDIPGLGKCETCGTTFEVDTFITVCPQCSGYQVEIIKGRELRVTSITVED